MTGPKCPSTKLKCYRVLRDRLIQLYQEGPTKDKLVLQLLIIIYNMKIDLEVAHSEDLHMAIDLFTTRTDRVGKVARNIIELWIKSVQHKRTYAQLNVPFEKK